MCLLEASLRAQYSHRNRGSSLGKKAPQSCCLAGGVFCPASPHRQGFPLAPCSSHQKPRTVPQPGTEDRDAIQTQHPLQRPHPLQASCWQLPLSTRQPGLPRCKPGTGADSPWPQGGPAGIFPHPVLPNAEAGGGGSALLLMELPPKKARGTSRPVGPSRAQGCVCVGRGTAAPILHSSK